MEIVTIRRRALISGVLVGIVLVSVVISAPVWEGPPECALYAGPQVVEGPYLLNNSSSGIVLHFPHDAIVTVLWNIVRGSYANFSVWPPAPEILQNCRTPSPSSQVNPPGWTSGVDPGPVCFESGTNGSCSFPTTQFTYGFDLYNPSAGSGPELDNTSASFMVSYP